MKRRNFLVRIFARLQRLGATVRDFLSKRRNRPLKDAFRIQSHLTTQERVMLSRLADGKRAVCEIGSYVGASACCFGAALRRSEGGMIVCIDTWQNDAMSEGNRDTYTEFVRNTSAYSDLITPVRGLSTEVVGRVAELVAHIDLLFIDGDHSYEGVKGDWDMYSRLLKPGSIVVFHDIGWAAGVQRVIEEDAKPGLHGYGSLPNMWWGTVRA